MARGGWGCPLNPRQGGTLKITPQKADKPTANHIPLYQFLYIFNHFLPLPSAKLK